MNDTLLLVGHGSRRPGSNDEVEAFVQLWRQRHPDWRIELCFIELAETLLDAGLDRAATHGRRVMVLPLIVWVSTRPVGLLSGTLEFTV